MLALGLLNADIVQDRRSHNNVTIGGLPTDRSFGVSHRCRSVTTEFALARRGAIHVTRIHPRGTGVYLLFMTMPFPQNRIHGVFTERPDVKLLAPAPIIPQNIRQIV